MKLYVFFEKKIFLLFFTFLFFVQVGVAGAATPTLLDNIRLGDYEGRERIVFDFTTVPNLNIRVTDKGKRIVLDFKATIYKGEELKLAGDAIQNIALLTLDNGDLRVLIDLEEPLTYTTKKLKNPSRFVLDINKEYEKKITHEIGKGLIKTEYLRRDRRGKVRAFFLEIDPKNYHLQPALAKGKILGRETVSSIAKKRGAIAAINASYFAPNGEILGLLKMDDTIVATTYFTRTALGFTRDGSAKIAPISYDGSVMINKITRPISGINSERSADNLIVYNNYFSDTTETNAYGKEFVIKNKKIIAINEANSKIPPWGKVVSVHGEREKAFRYARVGDPVFIKENIGREWEKYPYIIGAGPRLLADGRVFVTAEREEFPDDISVGRAPRTAVGILKNGHFLFAVVDGRQENSIGCTLREFAELLKMFGAVDALNFDGGGSSTFYLKGKVLNSPSDGEERPVGDALIVLEREKSHPLLAKKSSRLRN